MKYFNDDWEKGFNANTDFLDSLDFKAIADSYCYLSDLETFMGYVEEYVYDNDIDIPEELGQEVFCYYNTEDFYNYLMKRYPEAYLNKRLVIKYEFDFID